MYITSPNKFASLFNEKYPGAYRRVTAEDVRDMATCGLIDRYGFYLRSELETIRGILQYEHMRERRLTQEAHDKEEPPKCKMCRHPLPQESEGKKGRPRDYCPSCDALRNKDRQKRLRRRRRKPHQVAIT